MAFQIWFFKSAKVVRRCFHLPPAKMRENPVFGKQKFISQKPKEILQIFLDIPKGETFVDIILKNQLCTFILSVLFCGWNQNALYFVRALYFRRW